jgi:hypothetical protein
MELFDDFKIGSRQSVLMQNGEIRLLEMSWRVILGFEEFYLAVQG